MSAARSSRAYATLDRTVPLFAALGDRTRFRLVARLGLEGPLSISKLSDGAGVTRQAVTKHLQVLADAGLARGLRQGREQLWQLDPEPLAQARRSLDYISQRWDETLGHLKASLEQR